MSEPTDEQASIALGTWIGREQAFNTIAHHCSAARVACLKQVRDTGAYKSVSKTWDEFCPEHAGISRVHADRLIRQLTEFGAPYFQLTDIVPVPPAAYRQIAPAITAGAIEFRGEQIPITRENAAKIKAAVNALRKQIERAESDVCLRVPGNITNLQIRFDAYHEDIRQLIQRAGSDEQESGSGLGPLIAYSINKLNQLSGMLTVHPEWERLRPPDVEETG